MRILHGEMGYPHRLQVPRAATRKSFDAVSNSMNTDNIAQQCAGEADVLVRCDFPRGTEVESEIKYGAAALAWA